MPRAKKSPEQTDAKKETPMATESHTAKSTPAALPPRPKKRRGLTTWILFLALIGVSYWAYKLHNENEALRDPEAQARRIVAAMSQHIILPADEVPGVFPIDKSQATEPFFKNAQDGDLLVVYRSTQQAFIYSPARKILVNAGVLMVEPGQEQVPAEAPADADEKPEEEVAEEI